jgi:hypothetical protein
MDSDECSSSASSSSAGGFTAAASPLSLAAETTSRAEVSVRSISLDAFAVADDCGDCQVLPIARRISDCPLADDELPEHMLPLPFAYPDRHKLSCAYEKMKVPPLAAAFSC